MLVRFTLLFNYFVINDLVNLRTYKHQLRNSSNCNVTNTHKHLTPEQTNKSFKNQNSKLGLIKVKVQVDYGLLGLVNQIWLGWVKFCVVKFDKLLAVGFNILPFLDLNQAQTGV